MPHNFSKIKIKPLTGKELAAEAEQLRKMFKLDPSVKGDLETTRKILSKVSLSGSIILERRGGDMWDDLKKWLEDNMLIAKDVLTPNVAATFNHVKEKMKEIEKEYGVR